MRKALIGKSPNLRIERSYWDTGYEIVAGLDAGHSIQGDKPLELKELIEDLLDSRIFSS